MSKPYTVARITKGKETFEILVDPDLALRLRLGENIPASKIMVYDQVYKDAKKGIRAKEDDLKKAFGTTDPATIAVKIVKEGELQITADQRRKLIEEKKKQIVDFISKNAVDPRTNLPIPPQRIVLALDEAGVSIDPFIDAKQQVTKIIEKLKLILPLRIGTMIFEVKVPGDVQPKASSYLKSVGRVLREEWKGDGSWTCELEAPSGMQVEIVERLAKISAGKAEVRPKR